MSNETEKKTRVRKTQAQLIAEMSLTDLIAHKNLVDGILAKKKAAIEAELKLVEGVV